MKRRAAIPALIVLVLLCMGAARADDAALERQLVAQIQARLDAIASGNPSVWDRDLDPVALLMDEEGHVSTKQAFLRELKPLPKGSSGNLRVTDVHFARTGDVAVVAFVADEHEMIFRAHFQARFGIIDTYHRSGNQWLLLADTQTRLPLDPPIATLPAAAAARYAGRYHMVHGDYVFVVRVENGALVGAREGRPLHPLLAIADEPNVFFQEGSPARLIFVPDANGRPSKLIDRRYYNRDMTYLRI